MPNTDTEPTIHIGLAEAIGELRREIAKARNEGEGQDVRFEAGEIEVELALEFAQNVTGGVGIKILSFLDLNGKIQTSQKSGHKLKLKLTIDRQGDPNKGRISDSEGPKPHS